MNFLQAVKMALKSILSNKLRSLLTMLGIIIGVTAVIALVALGQGATKSVTANLESLGTNLLTVNIVGRGSTSTLKITDAVAFADKVKGIQYIAPTSTQSTSVKYGTTTKTVSVIGTNADYAPLRDYKVASGRFLAQIDLDVYQKVAVIGATTATDLFGFADPLGEYILIQGTRYKVVGVLEAKGSSTTGSNDEVVMIPQTSAERLFKSIGVRTIYVQVATTDQIDSVVAGLETELSAHFRGNTDSYRVFNQSDALSTLSSVTSTLTLALAGIAGISLLVGGIGIMNIMLVSVTERTREIGIRKAIGAKRRDILIQFLIESMVLSGLGGLLGIGIGIGAAQGASSAFKMDIAFSLNVIIIAFVFSVAIGVLFGMFPANKAAKLKPIDALRFE
ncbi:FtsX-like permease family protein [Cohnella endophytica]|uniref:FtsX-like permease family protein n=1 Tax=Cohnella endophytica TaxID=2419778 RepID=A0A494Y3I8_9BACL|nr:ABC transporter permease [Cohnella endophytica]RKP56871.1 FtsX-like permease family protein [Cohnella endophytica]